MADASSNSRQRLEVTGIVQGVGFRPFAHALALRLGLAGFVRNHSSGVTIEIEGSADQLAQFAYCLKTELPPLARIDSLQVDAGAPTGISDFQIIASERISNASTPLSPDVATCDQCLDEMRHPQNRRYRYPFINCTNCGPRYSIVRDIPYDRPLTTMSAFSMCVACESEYHNPANRRYHAQPNACPVCGPTVWLVDMRRQGVDVFSAPCGATGELAIAAFHQRIDDGRIVAVKGIGGFHLACSAENSRAIHELRERKGRVDKPLAIMVADVQTAQHVALVSPDEERLLCRRERPIVLLRRRPESTLSDLVAPRNKFVGVMLPYSPLHTLLVEHRPLVMTSGNLSEEPIVRTNGEARERLSEVADAFLLHDREIHVVCDDSVVQAARGRELPIRRARGYAPQPIRLRDVMPCVLAAGGELKAAFCVTKGKYAYLSPHIGDMGNLETLNAFRRAVDHFQTLFRVRPQVVACDMHPSYLSSQWAREFAQTFGLPVVRVQHHHAHVAALLAEHGYPLDRLVIGVSFDGTGYGTDGAIWGGEILLASCRQCQRWAHLKYVLLPGGDASVKHPFRSALAHLWSAGIDWDERLPCVRYTSSVERNLLRRQLEKKLNCAQTSSMGRLFDAVAAIIGVRQSVTYEAQAPLEMEGLATTGRNVRPYPYSILHREAYQVDPAPLLAAVCHDVVNGITPSSIVNRFHVTIAEIVAELCKRARVEENLSDVALSGGVFQNRMLLECTIDRLECLGFNVLTHHLVPPNDGGLALGQAAIAGAVDRRGGDVLIDGLPTL
jgi:hydrogenase maturation protein HypF